MPTRETNFTEGEYYHLYSRGNSKQKIFLDDRDRKRFLKLLYLCNSKERIDFRNDIVKRNRRLLKVVWIETPEYIGWKLKLLRNTGIWLESDSIWVDLEVVGDIFEFKRKNAKH